MFLKACIVNLINLSPFTQTVIQYIKNRKAKNTQQQALTVLILVFYCLSKVLQTLKRQRMKGMQ